MRAIAHGCCTDPLESELEAGVAGWRGGGGGGILAAPGTRTGVSITPWPFSHMLYPLNYHGPGKSHELRLRRRGELPPPRSCRPRLWRLNTGPPVSTPFAAFPQRPRCCKRLGVDQLGV